MSSRNPMNERYTTDKKAGGKSRKSAASAKPKSKAASSVVKGGKKKTVSKVDKRAKKREARDKEYQAERKYGDPPTKRFKRLKKIWIGFLVASIFMVAMSFFCSKMADSLPSWSPMLFLGLAYVCIIITLYIDLGKIRKERKAYAAKMAAMQTKESRAAEKKRKAQEREAKKKAEEERQKKQQEGNNTSKIPILDKAKKIFMPR